MGKSQGEDLGGNMNTLIRALKPSLILSPHLDIQYPHWDTESKVQERSPDLRDNLGVLTIYALCNQV